MDYSVISHARRMKDPSFKYQSNPADIYGKEKNQVLSQKVVNGRIVNDLQFVEIDPAEEMKGFKVSDFAVENLVSVGAMANMKQMTYHNDNVDASVANLNAAMDYLDNVLMDGKLPGQTINEMAETEVNNDLAEN